MSEDIINTKAFMALGKEKNKPEKQMETFENPHPGREYWITHETDEFTCNCPKTGQPDFANIQVQYVADKLCVELKSLKMYYWSFRNEGHFHEDVTNIIANELIRLLQPKKLIVMATFNKRGGLFTRVRVHYPEVASYSMNVELSK